MNTSIGMSAKIVATYISNMMDTVSNIDDVSFKVSKSKDKDWAHVYQAEIRVNLKNSSFGHDVCVRVVSTTDNNMFCEIKNKGKNKLLPLGAGLDIIIKSLTQGDKSISTYLEKKFKSFEHTSFVSLEKKKIKQSILAHRVRSLTLG